jgi:tetratricopeptide (TPR) repeat protein
MNGRHDSSRGTPPRTEPVLGNLDQLDAGTDRRAKRSGPSTPPPRRPPFAARSPRERTPRKPRRWTWAALILVLVLVGVGAWAFTHQTMLRSMLPQTQLNSLLTRADGALASGKLVGGPDSARDLYEAARVMDPDNERALNGLQKVGNAELERARAALKRHDYADARTSLEQARSLLGGGAGVEEVDKAIARAVLHNANINVLITQARAALANGRIDGDGGAAALFGKVLAGDPHNAVARHGMDQVGDVLATRIQTKLGNNDLAGARQTLSDLARLLPRYSQLPNLRAAVGAAERAAAAQLDRHLAQAEAALRAGKVTGPGSDNAEAQFKAALEADPDNAKAQAGLGKVADALIVQANAAIDSGHANDAKVLLDRAAELAPQSSDLADARSRLAAGATGANPSGTATPTAAPTVTPAQSAKVARLVLRADAAAHKGDIMLPPGDSAYDLYRAALAIDGNNARAQAGLDALPAMTRDQFAGALQSGNLEHAHDMLATLEQLDPGSASAPTMRHRLGRAWLDRADRDVKQGRPAAARTALQEAERLVPGDPRIGELESTIGSGHP